MLASESVIMETNFEEIFKPKAAQELMELNWISFFLLSFELIHELVHAREFPLTVHCHITLVFVAGVVNGKELNLVNTWVSITAPIFSKFLVVIHGLFFAIVIMFSNIDRIPSRGKYTTNWNFLAESIVCTHFIVNITIEWIKYQSSLVNILVTESRKHGSPSSS
jgi:hypothetical protein